MAELTSDARKVLEGKPERKYWGAKKLFESHIKTGEPLTEGEVNLVVGAGLAKREDFEMRGGGLYWHTPTFPEKEE